MVAPIPAPTPGTRVAVQPIDAPIGSSLRGQLSSLLQQRGFRVLTSVPPVSGTAQYPEVARDHRVAAFVVTDVTEHGHSLTLTFLVWNSEGGVADRWSVWAPEKRIWRAVAKGFWLHLGRALSEAQAPPSNELAPAAPLHIDASDPIDEPIVSRGGQLRRAPILH